MDLTHSAFGTWNGGRFMHYGEALPDDQWISLTQYAYQAGIRTFVTSDVYGNGLADTLLGRALHGIDRSSYCLVGAIGHDFYSGKRDGAKGFPRFTHPSLRPPNQFADYIRMATEKSLARLGTDHFDLLFLHNPDSLGYTHDSVWKGLEKARDVGLTEMIGLAPGPANGFTLDILLAFQRFAPLIDWTMLILNPFEPWPGSLVLPSARENQIKVLTRVVDYGGLFHDDVRPGHVFGPSDHRSFRPAGWVEAGYEKIDKIRSIADSHRLSLLQLACVWNLNQPAVHSVVPTLIQEVGSSVKSIRDKVDELAAVRPTALLPEELALILEVGDNTGCMQLKGGNRSHSGEPEPDRWSISPDLEAVGNRWGINPDRDLAYHHQQSN